MLDTEGQWSKALNTNNVRAIIRWVNNLTDQGNVDVEETLETFSCWVQRTSEFAKKELLTLSVSRCQGLWMFLDQSAFTRVHLLLERLRNILTLAQWGRRQLGSVHLWHGVGVPCVVCVDTCRSPQGESGCWSREQRALKRHIWLGRLVQWWSITGLLPKYPEAHELKRISQMWREMDQSHRRASLKTPQCEGVKMSLIQGMVAHLDKRYGSIWISEAHTEQRYPPPNLQALLKLVLVPRIDSMSVQAIMMYFIIDIASFLQCKDNLLQSFCNAFTIPPSFSQQIKAFWLLDHGHVKASMDLLLSPGVAAPVFPWQHRCVLHSLLGRQRHRLALWYLHKTSPGMESPHDVKLWADVLLRNRCVYEAWDLLRKAHTVQDDTVGYFLHVCREHGLLSEALKYIPAKRKVGDGPRENGAPPCPLSARLYQRRRVNPLSSEDLLRMLTQAVMELRRPPPMLREVVWPEHHEETCSTGELCLSTQALRLHLLPSSPTPVDWGGDETEKPAYMREPAHGRDLLLCDKPEDTPEDFSSSVPLSSVETLSHRSVSSSFSCASSWPPLGRACPLRAYESTVTLQRISALLCGDESRESSSCCSDPMVTPGGGGAPLRPATSSGPDKESGAQEPAASSAELEGEDMMRWATPKEDLLSAGDNAAPFVEEELSFDTRRCLNLPPQFPSNEDSQPVHPRSESRLDRRDLRSPDYENQDDQPAWDPPQIFSHSGTTTSQCFLELEPLQRAADPPSLAGALQCFQPETLTACAADPPRPDPTQDLPAGFPQCPPLLEPEMTAVGRGGLEARREESSRGPLDGTYARPLSPQRFPPTLSPIPGGLPSPRTSPTHSSQILYRASDEGEAGRSQSSSDRLGDSEPGGGWWKPGSALLPGVEPMPFSTSGFPEESRLSSVPGVPCSHSSATCTESSSREKRDKRETKQADQEEPAGGRGSGKAQQHQWPAEPGPSGQRRAAAKRGKRIKIT
ncbi:Protein ELYS [Merluccius polli]|uniref:Protein ELYS n=1 Tax=Merluccius polli TaxID=89951 RepID=A0AA47MNP1_MERPO|nr:Protein ELYS [Merluccius polli]